MNGVEMVTLMPSSLSVGRKFVNPHDIVLFPLWIQRGMPSDLNDIEVPDVPMSPSDFEDLRHKPAAQVAYRAPTLVLWAVWSRCSGLSKEPSGLPKSVLPTPRSGRPAGRPRASCNTDNAAPTLSSFDI